MDRRNRNMYCAVDTKANTRASLRAEDKAEAQRLIDSMNEAV
jgi:hypothetical protein